MALHHGIDLRIYAIAGAAEISLPICSRFDLLVDIPANQR